MGIGKAGRKEIVGFGRAGRKRMAVIGRACLKGMVGNCSEMVGKGWRESVNMVERRWRESGKQVEMYRRVCLLLFCILATAKVILERVLTCDCVHTW